MTLLYHKIQSGQAPFLDMGVWEDSRANGLPALERGQWTSIELP